ncbi:hypothetical protein P8452_16285 [Trifolium repens]|nr:hypothetical protein P8452_16285 [Trifolium repens]
MAIIYAFNRYDEEATFFDESVKNAKRKHLESNVLDIVYPAFTTTLRHLRSNALDDFKTKLGPSLDNYEGFASSVQKWIQSIMLEFDKGAADACVRQANWDASKARDKLRRDIDSHALCVHNEKLLEITTNSKKQLAKALAEPMDLLFEEGKDTWLSIRKLLKREIETAVSEFLDRVAGFEVDKEETVEKIQESLRDYARKVVENKAREEAGKALPRMARRFFGMLNYDGSRRRDWTRDENIESIANRAHSASLKLLSDLAAIRLDEKPDTIESVLNILLEYKTTAVASSVYPLASNTWEKVSPGDVLISPVKCKSLWTQYLGEIEHTIKQANAAQVKSLDHVLV